MKSRSVDEGIKYFETYIKPAKTGYNFSNLESSLNLIGYDYLTNGDLASAIKILKLNAEEFPQSSNAHDSLGEAYYKDRQLDSALRHYRKSMELDPGNEHAMNMIAEISKSNN
jgi:Tfp pilus assembly protein PilF